MHVDYNNATDLCKVESKNWPILFAIFLSICAAEASTLFAIFTLEIWCISLRLDHLDWIFKLVSNPLISSSLVLTFKKLREVCLSCEGRLFSSVNVYDPWSSNTLI